MQQFVNVTLSGLTQGMIYAAFALALVLIWRSTRIVNFAQGSMAMATTFIALAIIDAGASYWVALPVALAAGFVLGAVVERVIIRPVEGGPELNAVIVTLGLFVAIQALHRDHRRLVVPVVPDAVRRARVHDRRHHHRADTDQPLHHRLGAGRHGPAGRPVPLHPGRAADARLGVRPGGRPAARRPGRPDAHPRLGAGRGGRLAGRAADRRRRLRLPGLHGQP